MFVAERFGTREFDLFDLVFIKPRIVIKKKTIESFFPKQALFSLFAACSHPIFQHNFTLNFIFSVILFFEIDHLIHPLSFSLLLVSLR